MDRSPSGCAGSPGFGSEDPPATMLVDMLRRFGDSELACCCALAAGARELSGGRSSRVVCIERAASSDRGAAVATGEGGASDRGGAPQIEPGWHRVPVRGAGPSGEPLAWLAVEAGEGETAPSGPARLRALAAVAGLLLERHRLAREARTARRDAEEIKAELAHAVRGHLHSALLRTDNLRLDLRPDEDPDLTEVREALEAVSRSVQEMAEDIRELLEAPDAGRERPPGDTAGAEEAVRIAELVRAVRREAGAGEVPPEVTVADEVPPVRADPTRLRSALGDLFALARRSRAGSTLDVRRDPASAGVRLTLAVDLRPLPGQEADRPGQGETGAGASGEASSPRPGGDPDGNNEADGPPLREVVGELGGRLWIEAPEGTRAEVIVTLPPGDAG